MGDRKSWLAVVFLGMSCVAGAQTLEGVKSLEWSGAVAPQALKFKPGSGQALPNFAKVSAALYRSGQPTQAGFSQLASLGIKTILKFNTQDPAEQDWAAGAGIALVPQPLDPHSLPSYDEIDAALAVVTDAAKQPVLVHCHLGADRTGAIVAAYQVVYNGKQVADAVAEAKSFGYGSPGFGDLATWLNGYAAHRAGN